MEFLARFVVFYILSGLVTAALIYFFKLRSKNYHPVDLCGLCFFITFLWPVVLFLLFKEWREERKVTHIRTKGGF